MDSPYNPLDKLNLAKSIEVELLKQDVQLLDAIAVIAGAGIYALYYTGDFKPYAPISQGNRGGEFTIPIYVGKAIPKGGRKGGLGADATKGKALADRLGQHAQSIIECQNLDIKDFFYRHLIVDDIWIPLGENMLIETFKPLWNRVIDGFGNKDPGRRRATQYKSPWDILHPGRRFAEKLADGILTPGILTQRVDDYFAGRPLATLPKGSASRQFDQGEDED